MNFFLYINQAYCLFELKKFVSLKLTIGFRAKKYRIYINIDIINSGG